jgi:hypothetical protein
LSCGTSESVSSTVPKYGASGSLTTVRGSPSALRRRDGLVQGERFGAGHLDDPIRRLPHRHIRHGGAELGNRRRLKAGRAHPGGGAAGARIGDLPDELEELGGPNERERDRAALHHLLLGDLRAQVAALREPVGTDDRHGNVVLHSGARRRLGQVARRGLEELEHRRVVPDGCVRCVDHDLGACKGLRHPFARDRVDAGLGRRGHCLMAVPLEAGDDLRAEPPGAANDDDLQLGPFLSRAGCECECDMRRVSLIAEPAVRLTCAADLG